ncbi:unannotated protein [freshwater metagenome]|uniref:Unannotated protein n=1 Tax=freshwater metagenome TaxID=449393 RepID=A0A6J7RWY1_9ZZZZ
MSELVRFSPDRLNGRLLKSCVGCLRDQVTSAGSGDRSQRLEILRQYRLDFGGYIDVRVELVDEVDRNLIADRRVGDQLGAGLRPLVRVEQLLARPVGENGEDREDRREDYE